jgi:hypothetical protein
VDEDEVMVETRGERTWGRVRWCLWGLAVILAAWSWRRWPDVQVDFGRELYVPWRLTVGDALHRDVAWFNGPLSAWWNALWFKLAGTSLTTLIAVNLILLLLTLELLTDSLRRWAGNAAAAAGGALFLCIFAFGRYASIGNYNFVTPYSHELTHGLILTLGALRLLSRGQTSYSTLGAGVLLGLVLLTKVEVALAASAATVLRLFAAPVGGRRALFGVGVAIPIALAFGILFYTLGAGNAPAALVGGWAHLGNSSVRELPFYRAILGSDDPWGNLTRMGRWAAGYLAAYGVLVAICMRGSGAALKTRAARAGGVFLGLVIMAQTEDLWRQLASPFPLLLLVVLTAQARALLQARGRPGESATTADALALSLFALLLMGKMILNPQLGHYGFVLALPASMVLAAVAVGRIPSWLGTRGKPGEFFQATTLGALAMVMLIHLGESHAGYHRRLFKSWPAATEYEVGTGGDVIRARWRGEEMAEALADLQQRLGPEDTLLVLPEGVMLNYLLRRRSPTRHVNFMPPELLIWGEETILAELKQSPPDVVAIVHKDTSEYGAARFGWDYGQQIWDWIDDSYERKAVYGAIPLVSSRFGIAIMEPK